MALPTPRLRDCRVGSRIKLPNDSRERVIVHKCEHYAHFDSFRASLCCQVVEAYMEFTSEGWQCKAQ